jgi:hypothetical protein
MRCIGFGAAGEKRLRCNVKYNTLFTLTIGIQANSWAEEFVDAVPNGPSSPAQDFAIASVFEKSLSNAVCLLE